MGHGAWITKSAAAIAVLALGLSAGLSTAEAKGGPPGKGGGGGGNGKDRSAPTIHTPATVTSGAFLSSGAVVTFGVTVVDDKDPAPTVTVSPPSGSMFPVGSTTVTVTATDATGNTSTKSFDVTVTQVSLPKDYKAYWYDSYSDVYFEWDITIGADLTISGSGRQTALLYLYEWYDTYVVEMPSGLSGSGTVSGTVDSDGSFHVESSSSYWTTDGDVFEQVTPGFSGSVIPSIHSSGSYVGFVGVSPLGLPSPGDNGWSSQP